MNAGQRNTYESLKTHVSSYGVDDALFALREIMLERSESRSVGPNERVASRIACDQLDSLRKTIRDASNVDYRKSLDKENS